jgi:Ca2+-transporting ATPase
MALLLWVAGILAFASGTPELGWAIWAVIWINALFSFWQEYQAEQALAALKRVLPVQVHVARDGVLTSIPARELVHGDVIELEEGDRISADARLIHADGLYVDVSVLTGESLPVARQAEPVQHRQVVPIHAGQTLLHSGEKTTQEQVNVADIANLVLAGATVSAGHARAVVYATGTHTEFGQVAHLTTMVKRSPSTLEVQVGRIVRIITAIAIGMGITIFVLSTLLTAMDVTESFLFAIGIIVANVPEGLLPTVTLALALGVQRMVRRNALVRRLSAVETLSAATVICTDKTGTLTKNEMTVRYLWVPTPPVHQEPHSADSTATSASYVEVTGAGYDPTTGSLVLPATYLAAQQIHLLVAGAALCSNARLLHLVDPTRWQEIGDPTEGALLVVAAKAGRDLERLHQQFPRLRELPFTSQRRMMTVVVDAQQAGWLPEPSSHLAFTKGAPLEVLRHCNAVLSAGTRHTLTQTDRDEIAATNDHLARQGYRVLGLAARQGGQELLSMSPQELEHELLFIGLIAMFDPPRPEVPAAIAQCHTAGIQVTMVTGDYGLTAAAIARQIGLAGEQVHVVTGDEMEQLSDAQLQQRLKYREGLVFARMSPEHKLRLVQTYKMMGNVVAVTGDGVNDAPALRAGNIGVAMGQNGTDVAREAADIVLTDDNFATIVNAVEQGRTIYQNIRKFMTYILASNVPEIVPFLAMVAFSIPPALTVLQILAIDLGTDMLPALALGAEPPEADILKRPPRKQQEFLLNLPLLGRAYGFLGLIETALAMLGFFLVWASYGYLLGDIQQVTPAILNHTADPAVMTIYYQATTMTLAVIVACQVGNLFACRSEWASAFHLSWSNNRWLWAGIATECAVLLAFIYLAPLSHVFQTLPLTGWQWLCVLACAPLLLGAEEVRKLMARRAKH